jgi:predicted MFS family arabinose efflux permease
MSRRDRLTTQSLALWLLAVVTATCMIYTFVAPFVHPDNAALAKSSVEVASFVFKAGFGFFVGVLTGRRAARSS